MLRCSPPWSGSRLAPPWPWPRARAASPWPEGRAHSVHLAVALPWSSEQCPRQPRARPTTIVPSSPVLIAISSSARACRHLPECPRRPVALARRSRTTSMWVELVPSNRRDHSNPHLRVYSLLSWIQTHMSPQPNTGPSGLNPDARYPGPTLKSNQTSHMIGHSFVAPVQAGTR